MSEFRQKEIKLQKWGDDLKIKEKFLQDNSKDKIRMETYTIRTLKRKIVNLEDNYATRECNQEHMTKHSSHPSSELLNNIHKKVINYILKQVDVQLQKIENLDIGFSLLKKYNILLLQEHWLFDFQLNLISEIGTDICYEAKAVDMNNNIQPAQSTTWV